MADPCVFCAIVAGTAPATILRRWPDAIAIVPLNPIVNGHVLILPRGHVAYPDQDFVVAGSAAARAAEWAWHKLNHGGQRDYNLMVSAGEHASQTVTHLHYHYVPRRAGDGLALPWTGQVANA